MPLTVPLIKRHNVLLTRRAWFHFAISLLATVFTAVFFYVTLGFLIDAFGLEAMERWHLALVAIIMILNFVGGYVSWQRGIGQSDYHETDFFFYDGFGDSGSGTAAAYYGARVSGPAYLVSQIALAAPLRFFSGLQELRLRMPDEPTLEARVRQLLEAITTKKVWHSAAPYREMGIELACLVRLGAVDFSPRKGSIRKNDDFRVQ